MDPNKIPLLLGKQCEDAPRDYTLSELRDLAKKLGVMGIKRQSYVEYCQKIREHLVSHDIKTEAELLAHLTPVPPPPAPVIGLPVAPAHDFSQFGGVEYYLLFNSDTQPFLDSIDNFRILDNYKRTIQQIGANSHNGFIRKLTYEYNGTNYPVILKSSMKDETDSLVYEYLVGQCINKFSQYYPCFSKTFECAYYKFGSLYREFRDIPTPDYTLPTPFSSYFDNLDKHHFNDLIISGCQLNKFTCIFAQYIPIRHSVYSFLDKSGIEDKTTHKFDLLADKVLRLNDAICFLHMTYQVLTSFKDYYTHYDLHGDNVALVKIPGKRYVLVNYHKPDGSIFTYKMRYIPVIIDYGRSWIDCQALDSSIKNSADILNVTCKFDSRNPDPTLKLCPDTCGNERGYGFAKDIDPSTGKFMRGTPGSYYISLGRRNISHDLRLMVSVKDSYNFDFLPSKGPHSYVRNSFGINLLQKQLTHMAETYGAPEDTREDPNHIYNVAGVARYLEIIMQKNNFKNDNETRMAGRTLYGTFDIWTDLSRPFEFRLA